MDTDGNLAALKQHEREVEKQEAIYEAFIYELEDNIGFILDDLIAKYNEVASKYESLDIDLIDYLTNHR